MICYQELNGNIWDLKTIHIWTAWYFKRALHILFNFLLAANFLR